MLSTTLICCFFCCFFIFCFVGHRSDLTVFRSMRSGHLFSLCRGKGVLGAAGVWLSSCRALINELATKVVARVAGLGSLLLLLFVYALRTVRRLVY